MTLPLLERVPLAPYTTLGLGGPARYFHECTTEAELRQALTAARERRLRVQIIGGGSDPLGGGAGVPGPGSQGAIGRRPLPHPADRGGAGPRAAGGGGRRR